MGQSNFAHNLKSAFDVIMREVDYDIHIWYQETKEELSMIMNLSNLVSIGYTYVNVFLYKMNLICIYVFIKLMIKLIQFQICVFHIFLSKIS